MDKHLSNDDLLICKYATVTTDNFGMCVPACTLCDGIPCDQVLRFGDEACKYEPEEEDDNNKPYPWELPDEEYQRRFDR